MVFYKAVKGIQLSIAVGDENAEQNRGRTEY